MTRLTPNLLACRGIDKWIISWIGLKSGSFKLRRNHKTPWTKKISLNKLAEKYHWIICTWSQNFSQQDDERSEVENVYHAHQPMEEQRRHGRVVVRALPLLVKAQDLLLFLKFAPHSKIFEWAENLWALPWASRRRGPENKCPATSRRWWGTRRFRWPGVATPNQNDRIFEWIKTESSFKKTGHSF